MFRNLNCISQCREYSQFTTVNNNFRGLMIAISPEFKFFKHYSKHLTATCPCNIFSGRPARNICASTSGIHYGITLTNALFFQLILPIHLLFTIDLTEMVWNYSFWLWYSKWTTLRWTKARVYSYLRPGKSISDTTCSIDAPSSLHPFQNDRM